MSTQFLVELEPFMVPNFVRQKTKPGLRQDGLRDAPAYPITDLDPMTLDSLCAEFRREVFRKAGKLPPELAQEGPKP